MGQRVKALRVKGGIESPEELSLACGLSRTHVHCLEEGWIASPRQATLLALSGALGSTLDYLLAGRGREPSAKAIKEAFERARGAQA